MILICSAWEEENKYLDCPNESFEILNLGIGYLDAALNLEAFLSRNKENIEKIFFIGTAGLISASEQPLILKNPKFIQ